MSDELNNLENTVHEYRKTLDAFSARTGAKTHHVEIRGSGEEREKIARIDADLDAVERAAQDRAALRAAHDRIKQLEEQRAQPQFRAVAPRAEAAHDLASPRATAVSHRFAYSGEARSCAASARGATARNCGRARCSSSCLMRS